MVRMRFAYAAKRRLVSVDSGALEGRGELGPWCFTVGSVGLEDGFWR